MNRQSKVIKKGTWLYDDTIPTRVEIIKQNWDYYFEEGYDDLPPDLNENGEAFYVIFGEYSNLVDAKHSQTCFSENEAFELAEKISQGNIKWE